VKILGLQDLGCGGIDATFDYLVWQVRAQLAAGYHGQALAGLAGLHDDDPHEVRDLLPATLAVCGAAAPADPPEEQERAAAMVAFTAIAGLRASGRQRAMGRGQGHRDNPAVLQSSVTSLSLGRLFTLDDEWGAGLVAGTPDGTLTLSFITGAKVSFEGSTHHECYHGGADRSDLRLLRGAEPHRPGHA
jgi:hypothetical protein